jgi:hypothetical protein
VMVRVRVRVVVRVMVRVMVVEIQEQIQRHTPPLSPSRVVCGVCGVRWRQCPYHKVRGVQDCNTGHHVWHTGDQVCAEQVVRRGRAFYGLEQIAQ